MKIYLSEVNIVNYKSLKDCKVKLGKTNLLIGKNNSGKSNLLRAIDIGFNYRNLNKEDLYVSKNEEFDSNKEIIIDILIEPYLDDDFESEWAYHFGEAVKQYIVSDKDYFAFRTILKYEQAKDMFINRKYLINSWENKTVDRYQLSRGVLENVNAYFIDAKRDIIEDINNKYSLWSKTTNNFDIEEVTRQSIESSLDKLNQNIIDGVEELNTISENLSDASTLPSVETIIYPLTKDLDSLYKGMNIYYKSPEGESISVENNGMGTRSLAVLSSYKSFIEIEKRKLDSINEVVYNMLLVEEPEAHVHPHAQKHIFEKISSINAQLITTTHSPFVVYKADLQDIKLAKMCEAETKISSIDMSGLDEESIESVSKHVTRTKGDILFSNLVILCEGITEEFLLPTFIYDIFNKSLDSLGVSLVSVDGQNYKPFISVLSSLKIPWIIFSDGETRTVENLKSTIEQFSDTPVNLNDLSNIIILPNEDDIESYLYREYKEEIYDALVEKIGLDNYNDMKRRLCGGKRKPKYLRKFNNIETRDYSNEPPLTEVLDILYTNKANFGEEIARKIISIDGDRRIPQYIEILCGEIRRILNLGGDQLD